MRERSRRIARAASLAVVIVSAVYSGILTVLLLANLFQLPRSDVVESPALDRLVQRLSRTPEDAELREEIRELDLVARRAYFGSRDRVRRASYLLFGGIVALTLSLRVVGWADARIERPDPEPSVAARRLARRRTRWAITAAGAALGLTTIAVSELSARLSPPPSRELPGAAEGRAEPVEMLASTTDWPSFRGPGGLGVAAGASLPTSWDVPAGRGVLWRAKPPLPGFSSPLVWGGAVYLTGSDGSRREVYGYDSVRGELRWTREVRDLPGSPAEVPEVTEDTGHAAPSMCTDGERLFALFSNGDLVALNVQGEIAWSRSLGIADTPYGYASSPIATPTRLYVQYDQRGGGKLYALDTATGNTIWVVDRETEASWSSPALAAAPGGLRLLVNGNPFVSCYDAAGGKELWRVECTLGDVAPSPAYAEGLFFAAASFAPLTALRIEDGSILWENADNVPDVSSPVASAGLVFAATSWGAVSCLDARSGKAAWSREFEAGFYASPVVAAGRVYLTDRAGLTRVVAAAAEYREISVCPLGEPSDCTPAFSGDRIYLRGRTILVCVGEAE